MLIRGPAHLDDSGRIMGFHWSALVKLVVNLTGFRALEEGD